MLLKTNGKVINIFYFVTYTHLHSGSQVTQIIVYSKEEAIARFKQANFMDCRISTYPYWRPSIVSDFANIKNTVAPNFIMIDLDICNFDYDDDRLERILKQTLRRIKELLAG